MIYPPLYQFKFVLPRSFSSVNFRLSLCHGNETPTLGRDSAHCIISHMRSASFHISLRISAGWYESRWSFIAFPRAKDCVRGSNDLYQTVKQRRLNWILTGPLVHQVPFSWFPVQLNALIIPSITFKKRYLYKFESFYGFTWYQSKQWIMNSKLKVNKITKMVAQWGRKV